MYKKITLPLAGDDLVLTGKGLIDGLSFLAGRRVATLIFPLAVRSDSRAMFRLDFGREPLGWRH
jgi:hypothetical protein